MEVDIFMIVSSIVLSVIILVTVGMLVIRFSHPDDKNEAKFPRLVVVSGLFLACAAVLVMPFDVANQKGSGGHLDVGLLWQVVFMTIACFVVVIIPFAFFFYESDTEIYRDDGTPRKCSGQLIDAIKFTAIFFVCFVITLVLMYLFLRTAEIPVTRQTQSIGLLWPADQQFPRQILDRSHACNGQKFTGNINHPFLSSGELSDTAMCSSKEITWKVDVTFPVYTMALISFLGWFFFTLFAGIGLMALPMDLINEWRTRPEKLPLAEYQKQKLVLGKRATLLREAGEEILNERIELQGTKRSRKSKKLERTMLNKFEQAVYSLKNDYMYLQTSFHLKGGNPLWYWGKLVVGVLGIGISLSWLIHISIFMVPPVPVHPFLNNLFIGLEFSEFSLFGVVAFAVYSFYLLWCCIKGAFRIGLRIPFVMKIYPVEVGNTLMNSFLVNTWIILVCCIPCVHFCAYAFPVYARGTAIDLIFGSQVRYLKFLTYFFANNVFIYAMLAISVISFALMILLPKDKSKEIEKELQEAVKGTTVDRRNRPTESLHRA